MSESVDPTLRERLAGALRPDFTRTVAARRVAAGLLVLLAAASALRPDPAGRYADVAVAVTDLRPGVILTGEHVRLEKRSAATLPDGAQSDLAAVVGATLTGPARRGEVLTDARVLGSRLAGLTVGPGARVVPLRLADEALSGVIRPGDVVDVLGAGSESAPAARALATAAVVVSVTAPAAAPGSRDGGIVLVALPARTANALAAASLVQSVTLTIH